MRDLLKRVAGAAALVGLVACSSETVVHNLDEREANKIIEVLADRDIVASKTLFDDGRSKVYTISVPNKARFEAIAILNHNELPRRRDMGYNEIFAGGGLIPTAGEERAKHMAAIEGEIERQLKLIDDILDAQVQLVQPEENALRTAQEVRPPTTASVTLKYLPGHGGAKPLSEPQVQAIVAAGVERLTQDNVVVVMTPAGGRKHNSMPEEDDHIPGLAGMTPRTLVLIAGALFVLILLLALALGLTQVRLRTVRGRLVRLQTEIAKARRKPGEAPAAP